MKQQPIVSAKRIRTAVSAERIQREREAGDEDGQTGLHRSDDLLRIGRKSTLSSRANADESGFRDGVEAVI